MANIISDQIIEEVKSRVDIVDIISKYTELKKKGNSYMGLCPFHNEKTPSFSVQQEKGFYHCFGCGESGDVISFLMKKENMTFIETVENLAESLHIELTKSNPMDEEKRKKMERMYEMYREAAIYYMKILSRNTYGLEYLKSRGIGRDIIIKFGLGFAPAGGSELLKHLKSKGYSEEEQYQGNLLSYSEKNNRYFDRFRNRIMYPIISPKGKVIAFGGRVMDDSMPKYLNSSETMIFHKGSNLYGVNILQKESNREKVLLVEGYMDVISLYKSGIHYATASLGTAFTREQARMIKRYGKEIYICYDGDQAGIQATERAIQVFFSENLKPWIVQLPKGMDPDDYIQSRGLLEFEILIDKAIPAVLFKIEQLEKEFQLTNPESMSKFLQEVSKIIGNLASPIEQELYIDKVSEMYGVRREAIRQEVLGGATKGMKMEPPKKSQNQKKESPFRKKIGLLYLYALESEDLKELIKENSKWVWISNNIDVSAFHSIEKLYKDKIRSGEKRGIHFIEMHPEWDETILEAKKYLDLTKSDTIVNELLEVIYRDKLKERSNYLVEKIHTLENLEKSSVEEDIQLRHAMDELFEISQRLHNVGEGGTNGEK
ncbi:DNA primase [Peptoniphilus sp. KCTC 25270]|uniref:DNA primase n=1 Tax=Peptoniphilus sp. KCTC 25270 TaxID=2897414 RepID=UPI001E35ED04|nr:DNA primase [Peptoniphilus sp. KCTC 25270]MCD1146873.1 DNA primase [Peptoniphilus sp. KCTC 25270]